MISTARRTRLEKAASDNGFDQELHGDGDWLAFASTHSPLKVWLTEHDGSFVAAFSQSNVTHALAEFGLPATSVPSGAAGGRSVADIPALHGVLRRSFQLSKTLPNELLHTFEKRIAAMPRTTEAERLVVQRVGQSLFREGLLEYWEGRCAVTGLAVPDLLRASHMKPWAECESDDERLDVYNGLLLAPHLDAAFDLGFVTFADDGVLIIADELVGESRNLLGLSAHLRLHRIERDHLRYLRWHRDRVFRSTNDQRHPGP